jgi:dipeptidyl aminopeptidase/acylaminoacyl peptidase
LSTGKNWSLTQGSGSNWDPVWSPDGKKLAFYSDRGGSSQLWIWERFENRLRALSAESIRVFFGFEMAQWTPDSKHIVAKLLPENMSIEQAVKLASDDLPESDSASPAKAPAVVVFQSKASAAKVEGHAGWTNINLCDLAVIDAETSLIRRIARDLRIRGLWLSPKGDFAAVTVFKGLQANQGYDLELVPIGAGEPRVVAGNLPMDLGLGVSWSPDGKSIAVVTAHRGDAAGEVYIVAIPKGAFQKATSDQHPEFYHPFRPAVWNSKSDALYLIGKSQLWRISISTGKAEQLTHATNLRLEEFVGDPGAGRFSSADDQKYLVVLTRDPIARESGFCRVNLNSGELTQLRQEPKSYGGFFGGIASLDGKVVVYSSEDEGHAEDLWFCDLSFQSPRQLTHLNPQLETVLTGESKLIEYKDDEGNVLHGALLLPAGYQQGKQYPLITLVYGGSNGSGAVHSFGFGSRGIDNMQFYATRGYAVLYPDTPLNVGTPMKDLARTVIPAVRKVVDLGIADPARIGVMGQSYGGYSVLCLITQTHLFHAAVARAAEGDLIGQYSHMRGASGDAVGIDWAENGQGRMGGTPWQFRQRYIENSPVYYLDRVETPLLLIHGNQDPTVPSYLADEIFVGLRRLGKDVTYAKYMREDHWEGDWAYENMRDALERILDYFDRHLKEGQKSP